MLNSKGARYIFWLNIIVYLESYGFFDGVEDVEAVLPDIMKQYNQGLLSQYGHIFTTSIR